jgi:hypothetical protein
MGKFKNLKIQLNNRIDSLLAIGESKHGLKQLYRASAELHGIKWNPAKTNFIHSFKTADAYRQTVGEFSSWLKENKREIWETKDLGKIDKNIAYSYLRHRQDSGCSAYTVSKDMSALNKVLDLDLNKKDGGLNRRSYKNVFRSRRSSKEDFKYNPKNYAKQISFSFSFGLRRESVSDGQYAVKDISLIKKNGKIYCCLIEKGGKYREAPCLGFMQKYIEKNFTINEVDHGYSKEEFINIYKASSNKLFNKYTKKIDNHAFRAKYARALYKEFYNKACAGGGGAPPADYRGYNKKIILKVSEALGHNRPSVVVEHYLR